MYLCRIYAVSSRIHVFYQGLRYESLLTHPVDLARDYYMYHCVILLDVQLVWIFSDTLYRWLES